MEMRFVGADGCPPGHCDASRWRVASRRPLQFLWISSIGFWICCAVRAESPQDVFKRANASYAEGKFQEAVTLYASARTQGLRHWVLDYNLGNAYYKTGQLGKSIVCYARAFRSNASDRDILYNLRLTTEKAGDPILPAGSLAVLLWRFFFLFSLNTLTAAASLLFIGLSVSIGLVFLGKPSLRSEIRFLLLGIFCMTAAWLAARIYLVERPEGVIVVAAADVRSGPSLSYPANFTVPEGHRVLVLEEQEPVSGWLEIGVPEQGLKGWVPSSSIEVL
ncbi:MAG: SH3 domain-containing protein [Elusimicrobiota bacterium]|jgi:hypothetical protein